MGFSLEIEPQSALQNFLSGMIFMSFFVIGLFFLGFWKKSRDRFFGYFACAFFLMAVERTVLGLMELNEETRPPVFMLRLLAFVLIIAAIYDKNRAGSSS